MEKKVKHIYRWVYLFIRDLRVGDELLTVASGAISSLVKCVPLQMDHHFSPYILISIKKSLTTYFLFFTDCE